MRTKNEREAEAWRGRIELALRKLAQGVRELPPGADLWEWLRTDGRREQKPEGPVGLTIAGLFEWYFDALPESEKEKTTWRTERIHAKHLKRVLGDPTAMDGLTGADVQEYVNRRLREKWRGKLVGPVTVAKEIATLRAVWNLANKHGKVACLPPTKGLRYGKVTDRPPFRTWDEIERDTARGGLSAAEVRAAWDCLFLSVEQVGEALEFAREREGQPVWFYPLLLTVAHTGIRRSEAARARVEDFRFDEAAGVVYVRERKRRRGRETLRRVPMSGRMVKVLREWFGTGHPGGNLAFCAVANRPPREDEYQDAFIRCFRRKGSKWAVLRGYHSFRHSFCSNLAARGVDQRVIDELVGHSTEDMRRRYRHLFPAQRENAVSTLWGAA